MNVWLFFKIFDHLNKKVEKIMNKKKLKIINLKLEKNPRNLNWGQRALCLIDKIIIHQELGEGSTKAVHKYHISKESHLKLGVGAPAIAYHYTIEKDGTVYKVNSEKDVVWHTAGENIQGIGIMLVGDFAHSGNVNGKSPTKEQLKSLRQLLNMLIKKHGLTKLDIYGHKDFGKEACPGFVVYDFITDFKKERFTRT